MSNLWYVFVFSLLGGVISLAGGFMLLANKARAKRLADYATPFAAGALLAAAFIDLLPEAAHEGDINRGLAGALYGILFFFLLERFLRWFHHHHEHEGSSDPAVSLIVVGDTLHNFIDGIAIASAFLVGLPAGIVATLAVAAHEIPQEVGDFGLLLNKGMSRSGVIKVNVLSALATTVGALLFFKLGTNISLPLDIILGGVSGFFIYIAVSDIIPSIHHHEDRTMAGHQTVMLIVGVIVVSLLTKFAHQYIEVEPAAFRQQPRLNVSQTATNR